MNVKDIINRLKLKILKQFFNWNEYDNFCEEFGTLHYKSKLLIF